MDSGYEFLQVTLAVMQIKLLYDYLLNSEAQYMDLVLVIITVDIMYLGIDEKLERVF